MHCPEIFKQLVHASKMKHVLTCEGQGIVSFLS